MRKSVVSSPIPLASIIGIGGMNVNSIFQLDVWPRERAVDYPYFNEYETLEHVSTYSIFSFTIITPW